MEQDVNITPENNGASNDTPKTFNVKTWMDANGNPIMQTVTEDELINGYLRQSDYTLKTQKLAEEKRMLEQQASQAQSEGYKWDPNDEESVESFLQARWYAKRDVVEQLVEQKLQWITKQQQDEQTLQSIIASNPDLKQFEWAIRKIAATDDSALEDIVVKYGFSSHDKLSKAKHRDIVWGWNRLESDKSKPVSEWNKDDRAKFEAQANRSQFR